MLDRRATGVSATIAVGLSNAVARRRRFGEPGSARGASLARGDGWTVDDVICTSGPEDRSFEERHSRVSIAVVAAGTFQYRSASGRATLTPGSILLGSAGHCFECGHEHAAGDRCVAFNYAPEYFARIAADAGASGAADAFSAPSLPPLRESAGLVARACAGLLRRNAAAWDEIAVQVAASVARLASERRSIAAPVSAAAVRRVTEVARAIEASSLDTLSLNKLANLAGLSPYHFLRTFERVTGVTPYQYVMRARLREAAIRIAAGDQKVIDVAYDSGFRDLANFNRAFRKEFGTSPAKYGARYYSGAYGAGPG